VPAAFNQFMTRLGRAPVRDRSCVMTATGHDPPVWPAT
jgi:hypothetical protein